MTVRQHWNTSWRLACALVLVTAGISTNAYPQNAPTLSPVNRSASGDAPDDPGPCATDLSPKLTHANIRKATKLVADWQLVHSESDFNQDWTFAALYDGLLAASKTTHDPRYHDAVIAMANHFDWKLVNDRFPHADDMALGQAYLDLYLENHEAIRAADTQAILDRLVVRPDDPDKLLWWWCDALFMAPPVLARMSEATGDRKYLNYMDKEW